jgi:hypothetical protein
LRSLAADPSAVGKGPPRSTAETPLTSELTAAAGKRGIRNANSSRNARIGMIFSNIREASNIQQGLPQQKQQQELKTRIRTKNSFDIFVSLYQPECLRGGV